MTDSSALARTPRPRPRPPPISPSPEPGVPRDFGDRSRRSTILGVALVRFGDARPSIAGPTGQESRPSPPSSSPRRLDYRWGDRAPRRSLITRMQRFSPNPDSRYGFGNPSETPTRSPRPPNDPSPGARRTEVPARLGHRPQPPRPSSGTKPTAMMADFGGPVRAGRLRCRSRENATEIGWLGPAPRVVATDSGPGCTPIQGLSRVVAARSMGVPPETEPVPDDAGAWRCWSSKRDGIRPERSQPP